MEERNYKKERSEKRYSILTENGKVKGLWGNLKKLCDDMKEDDPDFLTYHSLSRRRANENPMEFSTEGKEYAIYVETLR